MDRSAPENSLGRPPSSAVGGSSSSRTASGPSKCTSPPKARVTALPLPLQPGDSGEPLLVTLPAGVDDRVLGGCVWPPALPALPALPGQRWVEFVVIRKAAAAAIAAAAATRNRRMGRRMS